MAARISVPRTVAAAILPLLVVISVLVFEPKMGFMAKDSSHIHDKSVLIYNRIPKTGSLSMEKMIRSLEGENGFAFHHEAAFKKRHLRRDEQVNTLRGCANHATLVHINQVRQLLFTARFRRTRGLAVTFCHCHCHCHYQTLTQLVPP